MTRARRIASGHAATVSNHRDTNRRPCYFLLHRSTSSLHAPMFLASSCFFCVYTTTFPLMLCNLQRSVHRCETTEPSVVLIIHSRSDVPTIWVCRIM
ncbi:hypothetical protein BDQ12DRAFT_690472 [Crucibulum laeve]|uniref:Uncharacterized protein n=1 Tax=Crucibulum laeve TaxID=68775 RepID=A0A5C3LM61_9AGAR|nr:hypothetical protein BDQ12DRAFT_690472 [Crucibulum laeve]